jgi:carbamoyltransferase
MSVILGINAFHAGASAALLVDGKPVGAIAEERLNRVKYFAGFPRMAVMRCLADAGLQFSDIDVVAVGRDPGANRARKLAYVVTHPTELLQLARMRTSRSGLDDLKATMARECGVPESALRFRQVAVEHHLAHIASAFFAAGWPTAAGISIDGSGDFVSTMLANCEGNAIDVKRRIYVPHSLGSLYMMVCEFIGYNKYGDEGKVMGLAPLGTNRYKAVFDDMVRLTDEGFELNLEYFAPFGSNQGMSIDENGEMKVHRQYSEKMVSIFGQPRERHGPITERDQDLAFGVQHVFENAYLHLLNVLHRIVPNERIVMAGGCALNSVANGMIFDRTPFRQTWIQPAAGDDGLSLGAALHVARAIEGGKPNFTMRDAYLGPSYGEDLMQVELERAGVKFRKLEREQLIAETVDEIEKGNVVGWYQGRSEWGPRALGNRSILTHPGFPGMKDILNSRIKRREAFRPFAPAVLAERQLEIFEHGHPSPFMLHVYKIRPEWRERLSAVNHLDNTGRLQSVQRDENPLYYDLISEFGRRTGIPVLLNTSFNENEPIVDTPAQAVDCFMRTRMDVLALGPFLCRKTEQSK